MSVFKQSLLVFRYQMRLFGKQPLWALITLFQPLLYLFLFGPLLRPLAGANGFPPGDAWQVYVPGLLVQLSMVATLFVGFGLIADIRGGVVDRLLSTPASRLSLLLGRVFRDCVVLLGQAALLVAVAVAMGLRAPLGGMLVVLFLVALLGISLSSFSYAVALTLRGDDGFAQLLNAVFVPLLLLSGILLPMTLAPPWLRALSRANPLTYVVEGARVAIRGETTAAATLQGAFAAATLAVVGVLVAIRAYRSQASQ
jgi:ABC-2 type transport system permease protein